MMKLSETGRKMSCHANLMRQIEIPPNPFLFHTSMWERAHRKYLERKDPFKKKREAER